MPSAMNVNRISETLITHEGGFLIDENNANQTAIPGRSLASSLCELSVIMIFCPVIVCSNCLILVALYRFKRLRTASNYFLASLSASDLGTGLCLLVIFYLRLTEKQRFRPMLVPCYVPVCVTVALCCASVIVMAAIAVDRFTSLAQPLQYNNMITRTSVHRYIIVFWAYAFAVGFAPIVRAYKMGPSLPEICDLGWLLDNAMHLFLFATVFGPCSVVLLGCYGYIYVVARYHARAIYTVEMSIRQHQDCVHRRYGQTLAITVGVFIFLWLPFQVCAVYDVLGGVYAHQRWIHAYLTTPIILNGALNPWIYAYKNTEMKSAVARVVQDLLKCVGYESVRYTCPVNVIVASSANADRVTMTELNNHVSSQLNLTNVTPLRYTTTMLMSSIRDADLASTATAGNAIICRIETAAHIFDLNGRMQITSC